jgi:hypothetical protein
MATKYHKVTGNIKWAKNVLEPDDFRGSSNYKVTLYNVDEAKWKASGVQTKPKQDRDGDTCYTLKRPVKKLIKGDIVEFGPPEFVMADGSPVSKNVGNGSEVEVEYITYDTSMGIGHRFNKVIVKNLIEYIPDNQQQGASEAFA